jgi:hypothetical protein
MTNSKIAIVIEYNATSSVILLINKNFRECLFIEMVGRNPKSIPPVLVSRALFLTIVSYTS